LFEIEVRGQVLGYFNADTSAYTSEGVKFSISS